jgi:hypothetical protein
MARSERFGRHVFAASIVLAVPAFVACNSIIGLTDFEKTQCPGARCTDDGGFPDVFIEGSTDGGPDAHVDAKGADPVSWAQWPMPNYGEGGVGQPPRPPVLTLIGDTVTDGVTQLVWHSTLVAGDFGVTQADGECKKLANGPWRVPKRIELVTLLDYSASRPFIDRSKFIAFPLSRVWTTSEVRPFTVGRVDQPYWVVNFDNGAVEPLEGNLTARVLCVRAK